MSKMMVVQVRFKDIPFEEAKKCSTSAYGGARAWWESKRGKPVQIIVPADGGSGSRICDGPFFRVVNDEKYYGGAYTVCPHIAEIGD